MTDSTSLPMHLFHLDRLGTSLAKSTWIFIVLAFATCCLDQIALAGPIRIGLIGDSMTDVYPVTEHGGPPSFDRSWQEILKDLRGEYFTFNNQAVDGFQTFDTINAGKHVTIRDAVNAGELDGVGIGIGVNNIAFGQLVPLFSASTTPKIVSQKILSDIKTIADTIDSGPVKVPVVIATVPDIFQSRFVRGLVSDLRTLVQGGQPSPFFQAILQLAPASFRDLLLSNPGAAVVESGLENVRNAILETNLGIQQLAADRGYGYVDLYGLLNKYQSADLVLGETIIPQDFLSSQYDFWHASTIMQSLAGNLVLEATSKLGFDTPPLLSDQEILNYWNSRAFTKFSVTGENTFVIDPLTLKLLTTNPLAVPETSGLTMLALTSSLLVVCRRLGRRGS